MAATGATFGKRMIEKLHYGKAAAIFHYPNKDAVRIVLKPDFIDRLSPHEFFQHRKKGVPPSQVPEAIAQSAIQIVLKADNDELFNVKTLPDFKFQPVASSFNKGKCEGCGEYVFERYLRAKDGKLLCIPCSGHGE